MKPLCQRELDAAAESGKSLSLSLSLSLPLSSSLSEFTCYYLNTCVYFGDNCKYL